MALPEQSAETETETEVQNLTDLLGAAYDEQAKPDESLVEDEAKIEENEETSDSDEETDELEPDEGEEEEPDGETEDEAETEEETSEEEGAILEPPSYMNASQKETFAGLPKEAQQILKDRYGEQEAQYTQKGQTQASAIKLGESFDQILAPVRAEFQAAGMDDSAALQRLVGVHSYLKQNPQEALKWLAQTYGASLPQTGDTEEEYVDPAIANLQGKIDTLTTQQRQQAQAQQDTQRNALAAEISTFQTEKDGDGNPAHPHFEAVYDDMVKLFQGGMAKDLKEAYGKAVAWNPDLATTPKKTEPVTKVDDVKAKAKRAKRAAKGVKSSASSAKKSEKPLSLRDQIAAQIPD